LTSPYLTASYAGVLALFFVTLSARVILQRRSAGVTLGTGGRTDLERAARAHANFAEYVPLALVLMLLTEATGSAAWIVHAAGITLLMGRVIHAWGLSREPEDFRFRIMGMAFTLTPIVMLGALTASSTFTGSP
jgi:uncharacterized membrane protein YecN with MAPEG domain